MRTALLKVTGQFHGGMTLSKYHQGTINSTIRAVEYSEHYRL